MAWSGMRGAVSLAVALALPFTTDDGTRLPETQPHRLPHLRRDLLHPRVQGLTLPALIRRLGLSDGGADAEEETRARLVATKAALAEIDALAGEDWTREDTVAADARHVRIPQAPPRGPGRQDRGRRVRGPSLAYQQMVQLVLQAQREALLRMRSDGKLSNEVMNRILHELDLEESRLEI